jgi:putative ABC transport system permease protein
MSADWPSALLPVTCLTIIIYVLDELSYDRYNRKADRIYRIAAKGRMEGTPLHFPVMGPSVARDLLNDYPEIREATRLRMEHSAFINSGNTTFKEDRFAYVDSNFFQVFTIPFLKGNASTALVEPNTVVITQSTAQKYFRGRTQSGRHCFWGRRKNHFGLPASLRKYRPIRISTTTCSPRWPAY